MRGFMRRRQLSTAAVLVTTLLACGTDESGSGGTGGTAGTSGSGGVAGEGGTAGEAGGSTGGTSGVGGTGGTGGVGGTAGAAGTGGGCTDCHGSAINPAPPVDLEGRSDTTLPTVGAHQSHLGNGEWHRELACNECHVVPAVPSWDPSIPSHLNGVNDVVWGPLAQSGTYDDLDNTCSNTYCHGATLAPDAPGATSIRSPDWTLVDGSQSGCGTSCHTLPPGGAHPPFFDCAACHASVVSAMTPGSAPSATWADPSLHINGNVELAGMSCTACHGDPASGSPAPPRGTSGETSTSEPEVGAHEAHLSPGGWHRDGMCADCHSTPGSHPDGTVDFSWGPPASAEGAAPTYSSSSGTCSNYCHGATLGPDVAGQTASRAPVWTTVNGTQAACGTACHTLPPGGSHPNYTTCSLCHASTITSFDELDPASSVWNDENKHVNGKVEF